MKFADLPPAAQSDLRNLSVSEEAFGREDVSIPHGAGWMDRIIMVGALGILVIFFVALTVGIIVGMKVVVNWLWTLIFG